MTTVFETLDHVLLMAPGPSPVAPNVLKAMSIPTLGHLDPDCIKVMDAMQDQLHAVCKTKNAVTFPISGTGSAGSLIPPHEYHTIHNPSDRDIAVSLHVYQRTMVRCGVYSPEGETEWQRRGERLLGTDAILPG